MATAEKALKKERSEKMTYELFKTEIIEKIKGFLPPEFHGGEIKIETITKTNKRREALMVSPKSEGGDFMTPVIYLDEAWAEYLNLKDPDAMGSILRRIARTINHKTKKMGFNMMDVIKERRDEIVTCLVNTEMNQELLEAVPHREFQDLSIVYKLFLSDGSPEEIPNDVVTIDDTILKELRMTEEELFDLAYENRKRLFPVKIHDLFIMRVVTCEGTTYGAASIICPETLKELKERSGGPFYLIPSSVHECLGVSAEHAKAHELLELLRDVNQKEEIVRRDEILGNNVYFCDGDEIVTVTE